MLLRSCAIAQLRNWTYTIDIIIIIMVIRSRGIWSMTTKVNSNVVSIMHGGAHITWDIWLSRKWSMRVKSKHFATQKSKIDFICCCSFVIRCRTPSRCSSLRCCYGHYRLSLDIVISACVVCICAYFGWIFLRSLIFMLVWSTVRNDTHGSLVFENAMKNRMDELKML